MYSRPFVLTSTDTWPAADAVELHTTADSLTYAAATTVALKRQRNAPSASADDENPLPSTVTGVPPSDAPRVGHTDDTATAPVYVYATPNDVNCWPFRLTSIVVSAACADMAGIKHSTALELLRTPMVLTADASARHHTAPDDPNPLPITVTTCWVPANPSEGTTPCTIGGA